MSTARIPGDLVVEGRIIPQDGITLPATQQLAQTNLSSQHNKTYQQNGTAASETVVMHEVCGATAVLKSVRAGSVAVAVGAATVTVDVKKNGTTVLSAVITLDTGNTVYIGEAGTITVSSAAVGDVYTAVIVATAGGGTLPTGLWVSLVVNEDNVA